LKRQNKNIIKGFSNVAKQPRLAYPLTFSAKTFSLYLRSKISSHKSVEVVRGLEADFFNFRKNKFSQIVVGSFEVIVHDDLVEVPRFEAVRHLGRGRTKTLKNS